MAVARCRRCPRLTSRRPLQGRNRARRCSSARKRQRSPSLKASPARPKASHNMCCSRACSVSVPRARRSPASISMHGKKLTVARSPRAEQAATSSASNRKLALPNAVFVSELEAERTESLSRNRKAEGKASRPADRPQLGVGATAFIGPIAALTRTGNGARSAGAETDHAVRCAKPSAVLAPRGRERACARLQLKQMPAPERRARRHRAASRR
jgi:hypothetical protein